MNKPSYSTEGLRVCCYGAVQRSERALTSMVSLLKTTYLSGFLCGCFSFRVGTPCQYDVSPPR